MYTFIRQMQYHFTLWNNFCIKYFWPFEVQKNSEKNCNNDKYIFMIFFLSFATAWKLGQRKSDQFGNFASTLQSLCTIVRPDRLLDSFMHHNQLPENQRLVLAYLKFKVGFDFAVSK